MREHVFSGWAQQLFSDAEMRRNPETFRGLSYIDMNIYVRVSVISIYYDLHIF